MKRIQRWADEQPDALAAVQGETELSYRQFAASISACQAPLLALERRATGTAVILTPDLLESWLMSLAARALGWNAIVVHGVAVLKDLDLPDAGVVIADPALKQRWLASGSSMAKALPVVDLPPVGTASPESNARPRNEAVFGSQILYTTGTTGRNKKVEMPGWQDELRNDYRAACFGVTRSTVAYSDLPASCGAGFKTPSSVWHAGGTMVFDPALDLPAAIRRYGVNTVLAGPHQLREMLARGPLPDDMRHRFELIHTSGPLPLALARSAADALSRHISIYYGATEIIGRPLRSSFEDVDDLVWLEPEPGRGIAVLRDDGTPCAAGEEGTLAIPLVDVDAHAYIDDRQATARFFRNGCFVPGDRAMSRADGRIRIMGREADVINISGRKTSLQPVEQEVQNHLGADEVCIFAELNPAGEEEVLVAVRRGRDISGKEMRDVVTRFLPFELVRFARLDRFPRSEGAFGKTRRGELRKLLLSSLPRRG